MRTLPRKLQIYTRGWAFDSPVYDDADEANAHIECRVFLGNEELPRVLSADVHHSHDFATTTIVFGMSAEVEVCTDDEWKALGTAPIE